MVKYENVQSSADKVEPLEITESTVIVRTGITRVDEPGTEDTPVFKGWNIKSEEVYEKDEYIKLIVEKNGSLEKQATDMQIALTEVYEMILV